MTKPDSKAEPGTGCAVLPSCQGGYLSSAAKFGSSRTTKVVLVSMTHVGHAR